MNGMDGIFAEMRKSRMNSLNEENTKAQVNEEQAPEIPEDKPKRLTSEQKQQLMEEVEAEKNNEINEEEDLNEMSRSAEKDMIKIARPIVQKIAYKAGVKVKNPGQNSSRFILVGEGAKAAASEAAKAVKSKLSEISTLEGPDAARIKAAKVSSEDKKKYGIEDECAAVIVDAVEISEEGELDESLDINKKATNGKAFTVEINGNKYSYFPTEESGLTAKELGEKYTKIAKYSVGKALAWLKKNATTPDSYRKKAVNEEDEINEEMTIIIDANDILKAAEQIEKAEADGKTVVVKQTASGFKVEATETEIPADDEDPKKDDKEDPEAEEECSSKKDETCNKDEETCPVCGKKHTRGEKCCEEESKEVNEEVDIAELAARLDECEGSDYMRKALEDGKYDLVKKYLYLKED